MCLIFWDTLYVVHFRAYSVLAFVFILLSPAVHCDDKCLHHVDFNIVRFTLERYLLRRYNIWIIKKYYRCRLRKRRKLSASAFTCHALISTRHCQCNTAACAVDCIYFCLLSVEIWHSISTTLRYFRFLLRRYATTLITSECRTLLW